MLLRRCVVNISVSILSAAFLWTEYFMLSVVVYPPLLYAILQGKMGRSGQPGQPGSKVCGYYYYYYYYYY